MVSVSGVGRKIYIGGGVTSEVPQVPRLRHRRL